VSGARALRIDDGDSFDLDHEIGTGEAGYADGRAGWGGHTKIAHAYIAILLEFVEIVTKVLVFTTSAQVAPARLEALVQVF